MTLPEKYSNQNFDSCVSTMPLPGKPLAITTSNALIRSVATISTPGSPLGSRTSYRSRTLPARRFGSGRFVVINVSRMGYLAVLPPSAMYTEPVMNALSSLARNSISFAMSSGMP